MNCLDKGSDNMCFGCSPNNPIGLKLEFTMDGDVCRTTYTPGELHQGYNGCMHGGLISSLLDEVMANWLWLRGIWAMTAEMTTRFSLAVPIGQTLNLEAEKINGRGRLFNMAGRLILPDGRVAAHATAKFLQINPEEFKPNSINANV